jgi:hypothetical protein
VLFVSLALCGVFLLIANYHARRPERPAIDLLGWVIVPVGLPFACGMFLPPVAIQFVLVFVALLIWRRKSSSPTVFLAWSLLATGATYGIAVCLSLLEVQEYARLRERFPYESMEERLPTPRPLGAAASLPNGNAEWLTVLEGSVDACPESERGHSRAVHLRRLHEAKVWEFVNSSGFGVARLLRPSEALLTSGLREDSPVAQPALSPSPFEPTGAPLPGTNAPVSPVLRDLHLDSVVDFTHPVGFGYFKDRRHVAGFQSHRFSQVPVTKEHWEVQRVELVGLLLQETPIVYVSDNLPRMDELRGAPTRPLDTFEAPALERLVAGRGLVFAEAPEATRLLGAIRSVRQCVGCHGGERGDLLGAFSYTLRRGKP